MIKTKSIWFVAIVGLISVLTISYFYNAQKTLTQKYRYFLSELQILDDTQYELNTILLENSLYIYTNQDIIITKMEKFQSTLDKMNELPILKREKYKSIKDKLQQLNTLFEKHKENVEYYLMLNAGVKNSLLFLTNHIESAKQLSSIKDKLLYIDANRILKLYTDARKMQDLDYISHKNYLLQTTSKDKKTIKFVNYFNLHSKYLKNKYPKFLKATDKVLHTHLGNTINETRTNFSNIALQDFKELDNFAIFIILSLIGSYLLIIFILVKYIKSHNSLEETAKSLQYSLQYDLLTGLKNRKAFMDDIKKYETPHLLLININGFKHVNDIYGNDVGNLLLQNVVKTIQNSVYDIKDKTIYRVGADEFGILFSNISQTKALEIATMLEKYIAEQDFIINSVVINITVSISSNNKEPILENADIALKEIKKDRVKHIIKYDESLNLKKHIQNNIDMIHTIKNALKDGRIIPYFQPIINLKTMKIEKYEALVRLIKEDGSVLSPYFFLDISKKTPYYHEITKTMIEKTMEVAKEFKQYRFSINFSMQDILDEDIVSILFSKFNQNRELAKRIDIELLESENLNDLPTVSKFIKKVKSYGSLILIDDFGSGYSNFSYFSSLDIDIVKIDGSIVKEITTNEKQLHMLKSIKNFSTGMGMKNVAEFVETKEIALLLQKSGIEYAQGYFFSQPIPKPLQNNIVTL